MRTLSTVTNGLSTAVPGLLELPLEHSTRPKRLQVPLSMGRQPYMILKDAKKKKKKKRPGMKWPQWCSGTEAICHRQGNYIGLNRKYQCLDPTNIIHFLIL